MITIDDLAQDKRLPRALLERVGVEDGGNGRLYIRYRLADGTRAPRQRVRSALVAKEGSFWEGPDGEALVPYGLWLLGEARVARHLVITEGESDCWTLWHHGYPALGLPGASMAATLQAEYLAGIERIYVIEELDPAGRAFPPAVVERVKGLGWRGEVRAVSLAVPNCGTCPKDSNGPKCPTCPKDPNALHKGDPDAFKVTFQAALDRSTVLYIDAQTLISRLQPGAEGLAVLWRAAACAVAERPEEERPLLVSQMAAKLKGKVPKRDIDSLVRKIARELREKARAEQQAARITAQAGAAAYAVAPPEPTPEEREDALNLLQAPDIIRRIAQDITALGVVGEDRLKVILYVVATSRKLDKPMSAVVRAQSASGKSYTLEAVIDMQPPEEVDVATDRSNEALYYKPKDALVHRFVVTKERNNSEEGDAPLRELQSAGRLVKDVVIRNPSGQFETVKIELEGPIAYCETTTDLESHTENTTRMWDLYADDSEDQTARIVKAALHRAALWPSEEAAKREAIIRRHRTAQRLLQRAEVIVPFADHLTFPTRLVRARRDVGMLLQLIKAVALLRQHQKTPVPPPEDNPIAPQRIEADIKDYAIAHRLALPILEDTHAPLNAKSRELLEHVPSSRWVSRKDLEGACGEPRAEVLRRLAPLVDGEFVGVRRNEEEHNRLEYQRREKCDRPESDLLKPEELGRLLSAEAPVAVEVSKTVGHIRQPA